MKHRGSESQDYDHHLHLKDPGVINPSLHPPPQHLDLALHLVRLRIS